jgi:hypothetical protein
LIPQEGQVGARAAQGVGGRLKQAAHGFGALDAAVEAGSASENAFRVTMFLDRLRKGHGREGALNQVKRVYFDYRDLGRAESKMAKRFGFFYNFYRNNLRYMVQHSMRHPVLAKQLLKLFEDDPDGVRHSWLSDKGSFRVAGYDVALGFLPHQQFSMFDLAEGDVYDKAAGKLGQAAGMMNPVWQNIAAMAFGTDMFTQQPLERLDRAPDWSFAPDTVKDIIGLRETTRGTYIMDPKWRWLTQVIPATGRFAQTQIMLEKEETELWPALVRLTTGIRVERDDIARGSLSALNRNIDREGGRLREMRRTGQATFVPDTRTRTGRVISALTKRNPSTEDLEAIFTVDHYAVRLMPYVTQRPDGKPILNRVLRDKIEELAMEKYPREWALMRIQHLRERAREKEVGSFSEEAAENLRSRLGTPTGMEDAASRRQAPGPR